MEQARIQAVLEAYAAGDAIGMPTEFMTRRAIVERFGSPLPGLLSPAAGEKHANLPYAAVTDDTEQNVYLLRAYQKAGRVDSVETARVLLEWAEETGAAEKRYIGPSSKKALESIRAGADPSGTGLTGTTCGGVMRTPAAVLYKAHADGDALANDIHACLLCTHNTAEALEAAGAYGFALQRAMAGGSMDEIVDAAVEGGMRLMQAAPFPACAPSSVARLLALRKLAEGAPADALLDYIYDVLGAGLPSADVCGAAFGVFFLARGDVWLAVRLGGALGGDTDTVAALAGALSASYRGGHNLPQSLLSQIEAANKLDFAALAEGCHA